MKNLILKYSLFSICVILTLHHTFGQNNRSKIKKEIYYLYTIEKENFIWFSPYNSQHCNSYFITDSSILNSYDKMNTIDQYYILLNPDCYKICSTWGSVFDKIVPNVDSSIANIIINGYPNFRPSWYEIYTESTHTKKYEISKVNHKKFMVFLVSLNFYNYFIEGHRPPCQLYTDEKAKNGMYIKLLVPLFDEEKKSE
jgi:hypothetical protein